MDRFMIFWAYNGLINRAPISYPYMILYNVHMSSILDKMTSILDKHKAIHYTNDK